MGRYAADLQFEKAEIIRQKIESLQHYQSRSTVVNPRLGNLDVFSILSDEGNAFVNYMLVSNGSVVYTKTIVVEKKLEEEDDEMLSIAVARIREGFQSSAKEFVVPFPIDVTEDNITVTVPKQAIRKTCWTSA